MRSMLTPIDNCEHEYEYDEVAEQDYCKHCGFIPSQDKGGWSDAGQDSDDS